MALNGTGLQCNAFILSHPRFCPVCPCSHSAFRLVLTRLTYRNVHGKILFNKLDGIVIQVLPMLKGFPFWPAEGAPKFDAEQMGEPGSVSSLVWYEDLRVLRNPPASFSG